MSTDPDQKDDEMGSDEDASDDDEFGVAERRKLKLQAYVASGIGKYQRKARVVKVFWEYVWPRLENELGWRKVGAAAAKEEIGRTDDTTTSCGSHHEFLQTNTHQARLTQNSTTTGGRHRTFFGSHEFLSQWSYSIGVCQGS